MAKLNKEFVHTAVVLGMFETGLGVVRSLGKKGVKVFGFDFKRDIGFYSKYITAEICPHPLDKQEDFVRFMIKFADGCKEKPALFITSDNFLLSVSRNIKKLSDHYLINMPKPSLIESISDKHKQYLLVEKGGIPVPKTYLPKSINALKKLADDIEYPVFIKALEVNSWREHISSTLKGFVVKNKDDLFHNYELIFRKNCSAIIQEIIKGPDTNNHKVCLYINSKKEVLAGFTLFKIRQDPIHFGVGSCVESRINRELMNLGIELFKKIGYIGVGSAEFKRDIRDGQYKLIELNPRYWQQNSLTEKCGLDFAFINYLDLIKQNPKSQKSFREGVKWVNIYMDFNSFLSYRKEKTLKFTTWLKSLRGPKIFSDFAWNDLKPFFYEFRFGLKLFKIPKYLFKRIFG